MSRWIVAATAAVALATLAASPAHAVTREAADAVKAAIADATVTARIKTALVLNRHLDAFRIGVETREGVVTLSGVVATRIQKDLVEEIARNAEGVREVRSEIRITPGAGEAAGRAERSFGQAILDATTTASVRMALALDKRLEGTEIGVSTRLGTVTLTGSVRTGAEKRRAGRIAGDTMGVLAVDNRIEVGG